MSSNLIQQLQSVRSMSIVGMCKNAGKTTMLQALDRQLRAAGREMLYLAPTASAVKMLEREGFDNATTVDGYLTQSSRRPWTSAVLVIDEAGLQSNRQGAEVLALLWVVLGQELLEESVPGLKGVFLLSGESPLLKREDHQIDGTPRTPVRHNVLIGSPHLLHLLAFRKPFDRPDLVPDNEGPLELLP